VLYITVSSVHKIKLTIKELQQLDRRRELKDWENSYDKVHNAYQGF
jgi:hypothetical protein